MDRPTPIRLTRQAIAVIGFCLMMVIIVALIAKGALGPLVWLLIAPALLAIIFLFTGQSRIEDEKEDQEFLDIALHAINQESKRLDSRRAEIEKVLMAYGEWMEFPDFEELKNIDWTSSKHTEHDAKVMALLDKEADRILARFSAGEYWKDEKFNSRELLLDLYNFMQEIARIYLPESERPLLETNLGALLMAVNRASLQIILLLEELPILEAKEMNLRKVADGVRKASKVVKKYEDLQPYLEPVRYLWQGSKLLLASNPLFAAGWIAGSELIVRGSKKYGKKALDGYLLSLLRQTLGIIAWETASIYDKTHRYRSPEFLFAVELTHLASLFPQESELMRDSLKELGKIPFRSTYDRIFLYRCLAQHISPKPKNFTRPELFDEQTRYSLLTRLEAFSALHQSSLREKDLNSWKKGLLERLNLPAE